MGNLSQSEIDALLTGKTATTDSAEQTGEIDISAFTGDNTGDSGLPKQNLDIDGVATEDISLYFTPEEIDALGEIGNICMGTSATTMYTLIGRKVTITTPRVALYTPETALSSYKCPFLAISVEFVDGLYGKNLLVLKDYDAALITDLLMGGDGVVDQNNIVLTEIHLSAVSEVMNQMIASAATAMSKMMGAGINISPPVVSRMDLDENIGKFLDGASPIVKVSFDMEIEGLLKSTLLQIMSIDMAKDLISALMQTGEEAAPVEPPQETKRVVKKAQAPLPDPVAQPTANTPPIEKQRVKAVKPAQYQTFDDPSQASQVQVPNVSNFDLINDIPLQVTVELGKTKKNLSDVLNFGIGTIIVLDKQAGELVDVIVNGKRIAKGEVVVIDENYGVRITELIKT